MIVRNPPDLPPPVRVRAMPASIIVSAAAAGTARHYQTVNMQKAARDFHPKRPFGLRHAAGELPTKDTRIDK